MNITESRINKIIKQVLKETVDEETYNVFHGSPCSTIESGKFKKGKHGYLGPAIYFTSDENYAKHYANKDGYKGTIYTVEIRMYKPLIVTTNNPTEDFLTKVYGSPSIYKKRSAKQGMDTFIITSKDIKKLFSLGYDGVIWEFADTKEYVLYDNSQITILDKKTLS